FWRRMVTSFFPMSPLPPITTTFMTILLGCCPRAAGCRKGDTYSTSATDQRHRMRPAPLLLLPTLLEDDDVLGVLRVQDKGDQARLVLLAGIPADVVQTAGRLVEGVTGLEDLGLVAVDGPLVLALQDVAERRAGMAVRRLHLARRQRHLDHGGLRLLPVQLLDDVLLGEQLDLSPAFAVLVVLRQAHPAGREGAHDDDCQPGT